METINPDPDALPPWIRQQAAELLARGGHAHLLEGSAGLGQYMLAIQLAKSWLCDHPNVQGQACQTCESCHLFAVKTHPDLYMLMPETMMLQLDWPLGEAAQAAIDEKKRKPSKEIRVDAIRDTILFTQRTNSRGHCKVVVIYPAECMNTVSANTLLKTLEEPAGDIRFVLASQSAARLLPTIRSRCLAHPMRWPTQHESLAWLTAQGEDDTSAQTWWMASGGRVLEIAKLRDAGIKSSMWHEVPQAIQRADITFFKHWPVGLVIETMQKLCHDVLAKYFGASTRFFEPASLPMIADVANLTAWAKELRASYARLDIPFKEDLRLDFLLSQASQVLYTVISSTGRNL